MGKSKIIIKNNIRIHVSDLTDVSQQAIDVHNTSPLSSIVLATSISAFGTFSSIKENIDLSIVYKLQGIIKTIIVEAKANGNIRALVGNTSIQTDFDDKDINQIPIKVALGEKGILHVTNFIGETKFGSQVEMAKGDIVTDLAYYLDQSEQIKSAVITDVKFDTNKKLVKSYGVIFQMLPNYKEQDVIWVEKFIKNNSLSNFDSIDDYIKKIDGKEVSEKTLQWSCEFTKEKAIQVLETLSQEDRKSIIAEHGFIEIKDNFCNKSYKFDK